MADHDAGALALLRAALSAPDPMDLVRAHADGAPGPWAGWTLERQLWYLRMRLGLTQAELALRSGVTQARISRIEAGADVKWSTLTALLSALGCAPLLMPGALGRRLEGRPARRGRG